MKVRATVRQFNQRGGRGLRLTVGAQMEESVEFVGMLVEMDTETPQSQQSIRIQRVHKNTKHADRDVAPTCKCCRQNQVVRSGLPAAWSPWALSP